MSHACERCKDAGLTPEKVIRFGREFLNANDQAAITGSRPTDPDVAYVAGIPVFDAEEALRAAMKSREARDTFRRFLEQYEASHESEPSERAHGE